MQDNSCFYPALRKILFDCPTYIFDLIIRHYYENILNDLNFDTQKYVNRKREPLPFLETWLYKKNKNKFTLANALTAETQKEMIIALQDVEINMSRNHLLPSDCEEKAIYDLFPDTELSQVLKTIETEGDNFIFKFDFAAFQSLKVTLPDVSTKTLCKFRISITTKGQPFSYPVLYNYACPECRNTTWERPNAVACTNHRIKCPSMIAATAGRERRCNLSLAPNTMLSRYISFYYYDAVAYDEKGEQIAVVTALSTVLLAESMYECVGFTISESFKSPTVFILDKSAFCDWRLPVDDLLAKMPPQRHIIDNMIDILDDYTKERNCGKVIGLYPIKRAFIYQKLFQVCGYELMGNIRICGGAGIGKSKVSRLYSVLLNCDRCLSSIATSISIPALRGTPKQIQLFNEKISYVTYGLLGMFDAIHIDELNMNKDLAIDLKMMWMEPSYSYNKAGSDGTVRKRRAQAIVTENFSIEHNKKYAGRVRYKYNNTTIESHEIKKPVWDESVDLYQPLHMYHNNPILRRCIEQARTSFEKENIAWIDGMEFANRERYPFTFYIENKNKKTIKGLGNELWSAKKNKPINEIADLLRSKDIEAWFNNFKDKAETIEFINIEWATERVEQVMNEYGIEDKSPRMKMFYYILIQVSAIVNERDHITEIDLDELRYFFQYHDQVVDVEQFSVRSVLPIISQAGMKEKIEAQDKILDMNPDFTLPDDEFTGG